MKALYRLLALEEGNFAFEEGKFDVPIVMEKNTLKLLIEGLRQIDEFRTFHPMFAGKKIQIQFNATLFEWGLHESTSILCQMLSDISQHSKFEELLDVHIQSDLDICKALKLLRDRRILAIID